MQRSLSEILLSASYGNRDTTFWRTADFVDILSNRLVSNPLRLSTVKGVDIFFMNDGETEANNLFKKYSFSEFEETSTMTIVSIDAFLSSTIDSISSPLPCTTLVHNGKVGQRNGDKRAGKGRSSQIDSVHILQHLPPQAASNFYKSVIEVITNEIDKRAVSVSWEFGAIVGNPDKERLHHHGR